MSNNLDQEYSAKAARQAKARADYQKRLKKQQAAQDHQPIADADALANEVARLAGAWGLKKKSRRQ